MADWNELDLGGVDAYAAAVKAGYTGTRQQWMTAMQNAEANGLKAEGYANGKQNGTAVESGTYFHDNAQYYKEQAEAAKTAAQAAQAAAETAAETDLVAWLAENITNPDSPPLDRTLASSSSAAPADMVGDLKSALCYDEHFINNGEYTIQKDDMESGKWNFSTKAADATRGRNKNLIPVKAGMKITYSNTTFDTYFAVLETTTSNSFIQSTGWKTNGNGIITIEYDGYLVVLIRNHSDPTATVNPANYNSEVVIISSILYEQELKLDNTDNSFHVITGKKYIFQPKATNQLIDNYGVITDNDSLRLTGFIEYGNAERLFASFYELIAESTIRIAYYSSMTDAGFIKRTSIVVTNSNKDSIYIDKLPTANYIRLCYEETARGLVVHDGFIPISELEEYKNTGFETVLTELPTTDIVKMDGYYASEGVVKSGSNAYSLYIPCKPNKTYYIIKDQDTRFVAGTISKIPEANDSLNAYESQNKTTGEANSSKLDVIKVQTGANDRYIFVFYSTMSTGNYIQDNDALYSSLRICGPVYGEKKEYVTPQMFGIRASDPLKKDATNVFNEMLGYMSTNGIKRIYLPSGDYWGKLTINSANRAISIYGDGATSVLHSTIYNPTTISLTGANGCTIHDLKVVAGDAPIESYTLSDYFERTWYGIRVNNSPLTTIENVLVNALVKGICFESKSSRSIIHNCIISNTIPDNSAFNDIDNSSTGLPGGDVTYEQDSFTTLCPYIHESYCVDVRNSPECLISNVTIYSAGNGIRQYFGSSGIKIVNVEMEKIAGAGLEINQGGSQVTNCRIDVAGCYNNTAAVVIDGVLNGLQMASYIALNGITVLESAHGGIKFGDNLKYVTATDLVLICNSAWYDEFAFYHLGSYADDPSQAQSDDRRAWNPSGWTPSYEVVIGESATRVNVEATIIANMQEYKKAWPGYSNGLQFVEDSNQELTQKVNNVNALFGYDAFDPDGDSIPHKSSIIQHSNIPSGNYILWNCQNIS